MYPLSTAELLTGGGALSGYVVDGLLLSVKTVQYTEHSFSWLCYKTPIFVMNSCSDDQ